MAVNGASTKFGPLVRRAEWSDDRGSVKLTDTRPRPHRSAPRA
jgi:hypothetical protein